MITIRLLPFALLFLTAALVGCQSDGGPTEPTPAEPSQTGLVHGEIGGGPVAFEFLSEDGADDGEPRPGPFLIRGQDVRYDDDLGALLVDITLVNASEMAYPEPVSLAFVSLRPDGVTILNADNGEPGAGAVFAFEFENDDAVWTPGEASLPRTVQFDVAAGVSIGFVARVDVGMMPDGGTLGGVVWHDLDEDGLIDDDEMGLPDVGIAIAGPGDLEFMAVTGPDGEYRVDGLDAGYYTVTRLPRDDLEATTPPQMQVILVETEDGGVSDFLGANFGCLVVETTPPGEIEV
ncbi:hypothetical protein GF314_06725, partial [bacterium]|nr:hypothetical protein [bacterium]